MTMMSRRTYVYSALVLAAILFVGLNIFVDNFFTAARIDLTQNGQYTLSQGTRNIIAKLPEPVTLKFYYSKKAAAGYTSTASYAKRVRDLLTEYAERSHGKIIIQDIDPEPFTPEEDEAGAAGMTPAPTDSGDQVYFGLTGSNRIDGKEVIPYFSPDRETDLEYDLTSLLYRLSTPKKPLLGFISGLPLTTPAAPGQQPQQIAAYAGLQQNYQVQTIKAGFTQIPAGIDLLLIAHPLGLDQPQLQAIDQYVLKGGRALIFVDPWSQLVQNNAPNGQPDASTLSSGLGPLLASWGVSYSASTVIADKGQAMRVATQEDPRNPSVSYPLWLHLTSANFSATDPVTANLTNINMGTVGALAPIAGAATRFEPLITGSDQAAPLDISRAMIMNDPDRLNAGVVPTGKHYVYAARISGDAPGAYPGMAGGKVNVVVVADSDVFDDRFWVHVTSQLGRPTAEPFADNGGLILNAVENLTGSDDLISLRTRTNTDRPFTVVDKLQATAEAKFRETSQSLQSRLTAAQQQVQDLQSGANGNTIALTQQQQAQIARVKREMADTRSQLRDVQHNLRADIDQLGSVLAFINIALVPLLVAAFALVFGMVRRAGRARRRRA